MATWRQWLERLGGWIGGTDDGTSLQAAALAKHYAGVAQAAAERAVEAALAAGDAARRRGAGDGAGWALDDDLETLDTHTPRHQSTGRR